MNVANQNFSADGFPSTSSRIGFHIGGFVAVKISDKFCIQPEVLYSTQGRKFDLTVNDNGTDYNTSSIFKLAYINIPVMFKYYVAKKINLEAGPQIGFLTSSKLDVTVLGKDVSQNAKDLYESVDFGLNLGAGYDFTEKISAGVRYNFGLANIAKTQDGDDSTIKNTVFSVSLAYKI